MSGSITNWLHMLRSGSNEPIAELWSRWYPRLCRQIAPFARPLSICDEEDIALSAIHDLCDSIQQNKYPEVADRNELWRLLSVIALRKARDWRKYDCAEKRGGGASSVASPEPFENGVPESSDRPDFEIQFADELRNLMKCLGDSELRSVVRLRLMGYTNNEIAESLCCSRRTVQYMLKRIRDVWSSQALAN